MTDVQDTGSRPGETVARARLLIALGGLAVAALLASSMPAGVRIPAPFDALGGYLLVWVPLLVAIAVSVAITRFLARGAGTARLSARFSFRPIDLLFGIAAGLILRIVVSLLELLVRGSMPTAASGSAPAGSAVIVVSFVIAVLAATVLAPLVEELFFRGLLLGSLRASTRMRAAWPAVLLSAVLFAVLHLLAVGSAADALVTGLGTLLVGLVTGTAVVLTGRLGTAIVTHVVFNASLLVLGVTAVTGGTGVVIE